MDRSASLCVTFHPLDTRIAPRCDGGRAVCACLAMMAVSGLAVAHAQVVHFPVNGDPHFVAMLGTPILTPGQTELLLSIRASQHAAAGLRR
jgi:hypothetical protein